MREVILFFILLVVLTACNPKVTSEQKVSGQVAVTASTMTVSVQLSGDAYIHIMQVIATDPALGQIINQACNGQTSCQTTSLNSILGSITNQLSAGTL